MVTATIKFIFMDINLKTLMYLRLIVDKPGLVDVQTFLYQKQKLRNLDVKQNYGKVKFVLQEKLMGIQYGEQEVLMSI